MRKQFETGSDCVECMGLGWSHVIINGNVEEEFCIYCNGTGKRKEVNQWQLNADASKSTQNPAQR